MARIQRSMVVPFTPAEMFELVDGIEHYPEFLPWCEATTVHSRTKEEVRASIHLTKGGIRHSFSTLNRLQQNKMIEIKLLSGPFRHLEGYWRFDETENQGCFVQFDLEFVFSNRLLDLALGPLLQGVASNFAETFTERAHKIYGKRHE